MNLLQVTKRESKRIHGCGKAVLDGTASVRSGIAGQNMPGLVSRAHLPKKMIRMDLASRFRLTSALNGNRDKEHTCMVSTKNAGTIYARKPHEQPAEPPSTPGTLQNAHPGKCTGGTCEQ